MFRLHVLFLWLHTLITLLQKVMIPDSVRMLYHIATTSTRLLLTYKTTEAMYRTGTLLQLFYVTDPKGKAAVLPCCNIAVEFRVVH